MKNKLMLLLLVLLLCLGLMGCTPTQTIEITKDNWQDFFELRQEMRFEENDFGDVNIASNLWLLCVREEYLDKIDMETLELHTVHTVTFFEQHADVNWEARSIELGSRAREEMPTDVHTEEWSTEYYIENPEAGILASLGNMGYDRNSVYTTWDAASQERDALYGMHVAIDNIKGSITIKGDVLELPKTTLQPLPEYVAPDFDTEDLPGVWQEDLESEDCVAIRPDGSCDIYKEVGTWKVVRQGEDGDLTVNVMVSGAQKYQLHLNRGETAPTLTVYKDDGNSSEHVASGLHNLAVREIVPITADNFWGYFHVVEEVYFDENDFGDAIRMCVQYYILLKDAYLQRVDWDLSNVRAEISSDQGRKTMIKVDLDNRNFTVLEDFSPEDNASSKEKITQSFYHMQISRMDLETYGAGFNYSSVYNYQDYSYFYRFPLDSSGYELLRIDGNLVFLPGDGEIPEPEVPEATEPTTTEPETTEPESTEPESTEPETTEPATTGPETTEPGNTLPETAGEGDGAMSEEDKRLIQDTVKAILESEQYKDWQDLYKQFVGSKPRSGEISAITHYQIDDFDGVKVEGYLIHISADVGWWMNEAEKQGATSNGFCIFINSATGQSYDSISTNAGNEEMDTATDEGRAKYLLWIFGNILNEDYSGNYLNNTEVVTVLSEDVIDALNDALDL